MGGDGMADTGYTGGDVLVFGAAGALGTGVAMAFANAGATVTGVDRAVPPPDRQLAGVDYQAADVLDDEAIAALFGSRQAPWAVINTVGGYAPMRPLADLNASELRAQLELNLVSAAVITKYALRALQDAGRGRIVHTASRAGVVSAGSGFAYSVSKAGVVHLVSMAAAEVRGSDVTVNCVVPSIIDTPANRAALPSADFGAWPKVSDVARTYLYLASSGAVLVNGAAIPV
jgi:NAD(P)-dependent dehydrogenase (short-subunit alcohol dehydrogenase family)